MRWHPDRVRATDLSDFMVCWQMHREERGLDRPQGGTSLTPDDVRELRAHLEAVKARQARGSGAA